MAARCTLVRFHQNAISQINSVKMMMTFRHFSNELELIPAEKNAFQQFNPLDKAIRKVTLVSQAHSMSATDFVLFPKTSLE